MIVLRSGNTNTLAVSHLLRKHRMWITEFLTAERSANIGLLELP